MHVTTAIDADVTLYNTTCIGDTRAPEESRRIPVRLQLRWYNEKIRGAISLGGRHRNY